MNSDPSQTQQLIEHLQEGLSVEVKTWINPDALRDKAKIVKAALALRNHNGGYLVIGFNNKTMKPDTDKVPSDVRTLFHIDKIQEMISKYASEPFEVTVEYPQIDGQEFPVIVIPGGVRTLVAAKSDLLDEDGKRLICVDTVYIRSLSSNNTASTTQATWKDWDKLVEICFDNREADIGRFFRRHLSGINSEHLSAIAQAVSGKIQPTKSTEDILREYLEEGEQRFAQTLKERNTADPNWGTWEVGLILIGEVPRYSANQKFLNLLHASNPSYSGWPVWLDSRNFDTSDQPYTFEGKWEALISGGRTLVEFMQLDPQGKFFLSRVLEDDVPLTERSPEPMTVLDFGLPVLRVAEAIAVGITFAKAMGCVPEATILAFAFKWSGLKGRMLSSWANQNRFMPHFYTAYQDTVISFVSVPLETPLSAIAQYVEQAVQPLFETFNGFALSTAVIEELVQSIIERRTRY